MLVKIGSAFIDPNEIAAIVPDREDGLTGIEQATQICITLRQGGSFWIDAPMDEAEAALIDAGVIENPYPEPPEPEVELTDEEMAKLRDLESDGYLYLARDKDGKLFAFRHVPEYDGAYWNDPSINAAAGTLRIHEGFDFIDADAEEPTEIFRLLGYPF